jgi:ATP-dependent RNA helicase DDX54/DBP10
LLFSATLPSALAEFARAGLHNPILVRLDVEAKLSENLRMSFLASRVHDKPALVVYLIKDLIPRNQQTVIFVATKYVICVDAVLFVMKCEVPVLGLFWTF